LSRTSTSSSVQETEITTLRERVAELNEALQKSYKEYQKYVKESTE
jgi:phage-related tail protein